ncbi:hypothetical protein FNH22_12755 [Fulvivirga sp. M361]|uniref:hypothetical protein n=1 Tax=Fulvivirga sp. M361 TaxID=2594266 RepID=UPI00117A3F31|nr:hypothetical protein [Fulvivirga sp. M361]TRX58740.1 hypothetical protein FNH22_12755 [Fulvivirga sp. M361]
MLLHKVGQTSRDIDIVALNVEVEEKSENSSEEDECHDIDFENHHLDDTALWYNHLILYSSAYTYSIEVPPEHL